VLLTTPFRRFDGYGHKQEGNVRIQRILPREPTKSRPWPRVSRCFDKKAVALAAGQSLGLDISLNLEVEKEKVEVNSSTTQVDVSPQNNANSITLQGKDLGSPL